MLEHIPGLPDLILFWMNDVSVVRVSRCGITRGTLFGKYVLTLSWMIMTDDSFKIVLNWAVLTCASERAASRCPGCWTLAVLALRKVDRDADHVALLSLCLMSRRVPNAAPRPESCPLAACSRMCLGLCITHVLTGHVHSAGLLARDLPRHWPALDPNTILLAYGRASVQAFALAVSRLEVNGLLHNFAKYLNHFSSQE